MMKYVYPVIFTPCSAGYLVTVPDLDINTQGNTLPEAIEMARDAICLWGITQEDLGNPIPEPSVLMPEHAEYEICSLVDADFTAYRRANENKAVKKTLSIPSWLNVEAEKAGINFSRVLQEALMQKLNLSR